MTDYTQTWVDTLRQVHACLPETEIIRYTTQDGQTAWAQAIVIDILTPRNIVRRLAVDGVTEDGGEMCRDEWLTGADDFPPEIIPLLPGLTGISDGQDAGRGAPDTAPARPASPQEQAARGPHAALPGPCPPIPSQGEPVLTSPPAVIAADHGPYTVTYTITPSPAAPQPEPAGPGAGCPLCGAHAPFPPPPPPRAVARDAERTARVLAWLADNSHRAGIRTDEAARVAGISANRLQAIFRRDLGRSPLQVLREIRLHRAHLALTGHAPAPATIAEAARIAGYARVTRFSAAYRQRYGRRPSLPARVP